MGISTASFRRVSTGLSSRIPTLPHSGRPSSREVDPRPIVNFDLCNSIRVLERTPRVVEALLSGIPDVWTTGNEGPDTWSPFDNVGHLIHCELANWMPRVHIILSESAERRFEPADRFSHLNRSKGRALSELLAEFRQLREQSLTDLRGLNLKAAQLQRTGEHPEFGSVTLEQLLAAW